ncbi:GNAT family N-acetyltransferase [Deinococcus ficus]|uniref:N-acetyltransferase domain-containing protein n=1 Tax=Deinococcus ficus TaxID=317577 RepID=A0A221SXZ0_9DEIO|nr:GNAT family N-acetyltransferase [Deinococcus ficus]ASN81517.1 hypothetical protein DFI_11370 [Deinococcus ficus]GHF91450.1 hypothetical protein GCM10017782_30420 [Deinococcus ficus]
MTRESVSIRDQRYQYLVQDHGLQGFDLILYRAAPRSLVAVLTRDLLRPAPGVEVARMSVGAVNGDDVLNQEVGFGYARCRLRVVHEFRNLGLGTWLLRQARVQAAARRSGLAGELHAGQEARARSYYTRHGARLIERPLHPRHPWVVLDANAALDPGSGEEPGRGTPGRAGRGQQVA